MEPLNRKELFDKSRYFLVGKLMYIILTLFFISILVYAIIIQDKKTVFFGILVVQMQIILHIWDRTIPYFLDLICLEYKITDLVIENRGDGPIQGKYKTHYIGGYCKVACIDGKKLRLIDVNKINVKIPDYKSDDQYKLVYLKYSKIIIDSIIIPSEPLKSGKKYKKRR